jgi:predicted NBD/HSP70 family sugar kinase
MNDRSALELLLEHGALTRAELSDLTGLSRPTTGQLLARLRTSGAVVSDGHRTGNRGPNAELYRLDPALTYAAALDVSPGRVTAAVADVTETVLAIHERRVDPGTQACLTVHEALARVLDDAGLTAKSLAHVTVGTPGSIDPITGRLEYASHLRGWHGDDLPARLSEAIGVPVDLVNDVRLAAVAELAARGNSARDLAVLWMDAGLGLAHVSAGQVLSGARGGAGEVGYMPVPGADVARQVRRRNTGGFQALVGAPAVRELLAAAGFRSRTADAALRRAVAAAYAGDARAGAALDELGRRVATGLAAICAVIDPPLVVLAGGVAVAGGDALRSRVQRELDEISMTRPPVEITLVAERPVLRGAVRAAVAKARDTAFAAYLT